MKTGPLFALLFGDTGYIYVARLVVRLERLKLSRALLSVEPSHVEGHHKSGGAH